MHEKNSTVLDDLLTGDRGLWIGGRRVAGEGDPLTLISPAIGEALGEYSAASAAQVDAAVATARDAFRSTTWAQDDANRAQVLRRLAAVVEEHAEEIAYLDAVEAGKVYTDSLDEDVPDVAANLRYFADLISRDEGRYLRDSSGWGWVRKVPVGVVAAVLPWNYPIAMLGWKVAPALAAGNALVFKPSEDSMLSTLRFAELADKAGVPPGVVNVVVGPGTTTGQQLGLHPDIDALAFTGSGRAGKALLEASARSNLKKVSLELGGRAGYIVDDEHATDLDGIAADVAGAAFGTSGQNCTAASRVIFVGDDEERFARFRDALIKAADEIVVGDPLSPDTTMGPVINSKAQERMTAWVEEAVSLGAEVLHATESVPARGTWYPPTILQGVPDASRLGQDEIFGPITQLIQVSTREEAVDAINGEPYGLASTVWCEDLAQVHWWAERIRVGTLAVNGYSEGTVATPFGGMRQSGFWGRDNGPEALDSYQEAMTVWIANA